MKITLATFLAVSISCAAPILDLNNTGVGASGNRDINWTVLTQLTCPLLANCVSNADPTAFIPVDQVGTSPVGFPGKFWNTVTKESLWISPGLRDDNTQEENQNFPNLDFATGIFEYRTTFTISDSAFVGTAQIVGEYWADGRINHVGTGFASVLGTCGIYLNDICAYDAAVDPPASFTGPNGEFEPAGTLFTITSGFQQGLNVLTFVALNVNNETGLRVTFREAAYDIETGEIPEPVTFALTGAGLVAMAAIAAKRSKRG